MIAYLDFNRFPQNSVKADLDFRDLQCQLFNNIISDSVFSDFQRQLFINIKADSDFSQFLSSQLNIRMVANKHKCIIKNKMSSIFQLIVGFEQSIDAFPLFQLIDVSIPDENYLCSVFQMVAHGHNTFIESTCFNDGSFQLVFMKFRRAIHQGIQAKLHQTIQVKFHQVIQVKLHQITPATIRSDSFKLIDMLASEEAREP